MARCNFGHWLLYRSDGAGNEMNVTDEIKTRVDAVEFISRYVPLQRAGRSFKARCPFHEERTPSFVVFPESGTWRCFGACSTGGDLFSFLMQKENMEFREALQTLAQEAGVQLPERSGDGNNQERDLVYELNAKAADFFRDQLHRSQEAQAARDYLQQRGINSQVAAQFQLGFAADSWEALRDHLVQAGYSLDTLHRADLVKHHEERDSFYDSFRNRLMIPILDRQRRIIGFGGRVLDDSIPKYLNTAETALFHKSHVVYGLDRAFRAIREADSVIIVEGYMDVIAAHQFGFMNVVACLGTALTTEQLRQINRYTNNFIVALDADTAGQQATIRSINQARQALRKAKPVPTPSGDIPIEYRLGANLLIAGLPEGRDPDDIIRESTDAWQELIESTKPLVDFYFEIVGDQHDLESARGKGDAVSELAPLIAELREDEERQHYIQRLSRRVRTDEKVIEQRVQAASRALRQPPRTGRNRRQFSQPQSRLSPAGSAIQTPLESAPQEEIPDQAAPDSPTNGSPLPQAPDPVMFGPEEKLENSILSYLIYDPHLLVELKNMTQKEELDPLGSDDFQQIEYREIFEAVRRFIASDVPWDFEAFREMLNPNLHTVLPQLMMEPTMPQREPADIQEALFKLFIRLRDSRLRKVSTDVKFMFLDAEESKDGDAIRRYATIINTIRRDRNHLERVLVRRSQVSYGAARTDLGIVIAPESPQ